MNDHIKQTAMRLCGLRDALDMTIQEVAEKCGVPVEEYIQYESGNFDIPMSFLCNVATVMGVEPSELFSGDSPKMSNYWLVRKGKGAIIERSKAYRYQGLALGFKQAKASPFIVTVEPKVDNIVHLNSHSGQEFNLILKGKLMITIDGRELILGKGDSIYFDSSLPHGMVALNNESAIFLAIII